MNATWLAAWFAFLFGLRFCAALTINTLTPFGAEIFGADIEHGIDENEFHAVRDALLKHKVVVLRNQVELSIDSQRKFSKLFGTLLVHGDSASHLPGYNDVNVVSNIKNESTGRYIGLNGLEVDLFHSDLGWSSLPAKITIAYGSIIPSNCGDTMFLNSVEAYNLLNDTMKEMLSELSGVYSYLKLRPIINGTYDGLTEAQVAKMNGTIHPLITTHPETGEQNIYATPGHTLRVVGMEEEQSVSLLQYLFDHTSQPSVTYRHVWQSNDLVMWDNRGELI